MAQAQLGNTKYNKQDWLTYYIKIVFVHKGIYVTYKTLIVKC